MSVVKTQPGELYPCSAWPTISAATISLSADLSAIIAISVGPAKRSIPTLPNKIRFASATYWFPAPTKKSTSGLLKHPYAIDAIAAIPPKFKITSAPQRLAA